MLPLPHQRETYWCRRILKAVRTKLFKLGKGHYEQASVQHLIIYDSMGVVGLNLPEAMRLEARPSWLAGGSGNHIRVLVYEFGGL
jgi:hypothetical protein